jgi:VanZ family protein
MLVRYRRIAAILLTLAIILGLFVLGTQSFAVKLIPTPWDKLIHCALFALLTWGIGLATGLQGKQMLMVTATAALFVGMLDEYHQMYLPGREPGLDDLAADVTGIIIGIAFLAKGRISQI